MASHHFVFRSKRERELESDLLKNYREIGIAAIAAASRAGRTEQRPVIAQPQLRAANGRD